MFVYILVAALAVSAGVMFGVSVRPPFRRGGVVAGLLVVGVVAAAGGFLATEAPGSGPLFAIVGSVTAVSIAAHARREELPFLGEPYWRRLLLVLWPRSGKLDAPSERPRG